MMKLSTLVLAVVLLCHTACTWSSEPRHSGTEPSPGRLPKAASVPPAESELASEMRLREEAGRALADQGMGPLQADLELVSERVQLLRERTPVALYERALEGAGGGVRRAVGRYQAVYRTEQTPVLSEIVPYCFSWVARTPGSAVPAPNLTTLPSGQLAFSEIQAEGLTTTLQEEGHQITLLAPGFTSPERSTLEYTSIALRPLSPMILASSAPAASSPRTPVTDDWFHRFGIPESPALRWRHLHRRLAYDVTPEDARYVAAAEELDSLIKTAVTATLTFPQTLEDVRFATGQALINLMPVAEEQADLIVGFDGIQAYRYTVRFPSGVLFDSVQYWHILSEEHGFARLYSYADYAAQVGRPFATLGAWKLVPVEEASLPGL